MCCTHGHNDHVNAAPALADAVGAPIALHPADRMLWDQVHPDRAPDRDLADGDVLTVAGVDLTAAEAPSHGGPGASAVEAVRRLWAER